MTSKQATKINTLAHLAYKVLAFVILPYAAFNPQVVDEWTKRVIRQHRQPDDMGGVEYWRIGKIDLLWYSEYVEITRKSRVLRKTKLHVYRPGFWLLRLWWAL